MSTENLVAALSGQAIANSFLQKRERIFVDNLRKHFDPERILKVVFDTSRREARKLIEEIEKKDEFVKDFTGECRELAGEMFGLTDSQQLAEVLGMAKDMGDAEANGFFDSIVNTVKAGAGGSGVGTGIGAGIGALVGGLPTGGLGAVPGAAIGGAAGGAVGAGLGTFVGALSEIF